ncbi:MAG: DUF2975 domain-containing protein [Propionibacteriaceae bacterium]|nr:DUF2975 domain-containing protein [Propionibacteriaceae bacterium]
MRWSPEKSVRLSEAVTWVALVCAIVSIPLLPFLPRILYLPGTLLFDSRYLTEAFVPLYLCLACGVVALVILLFLLRDIGRGEVFTQSNVTRLRVISWCGFAILVVCVAAAILVSARPTFILLAAAAGFLGLLMRVIKNVIDAARLLKEDADYTI